MFENAHAVSAHRDSRPSGLAADNQLGINGVALAANALDSRSVLGRGNAAGTWISPEFHGEVISGIGQGRGCANRAIPGATEAKGLSNMALDNRNSVGK